MARPIVLSNGELHVGINTSGLVHDFYFPYVGFENHSAGQGLQHRVGVWADGAMHWLDSSEWHFTFRYPHSALIGHTLAKHEGLGIILEFDDVVDGTVSAFMRNIHVVNLRPERRELRLFMHQAFAIGDGRSNTDTAQYLPDSNAILHYRGRRAFVISGTANDQPFDQYTVGLFGIEGHEGTWRDADDGELSFGNVEHGRVDSILRFRLELDGLSSTRVHYWIAAGTSTREALYVHKMIQDDGVAKRLHATAKWWQQWLEPTETIVGKLPLAHRRSFMQSVMIIKSQIDKRGAVMASTDSAMLNYSRDAYAYCWPRDGAYVLWPLIRMGYADEPHRFFDFCRRGLHSGGYLMHKYRADGALGSSWHPYVHENGENAAPIQEDETALTLFVFAQYYHKNPSPRLLSEFYVSMVVPMADFLAGYIDQATGLPKPSYDLWEEVFMTTTYTTSVVYGALLAAAELAEAANDADHAVAWRAAADDIQTAAHRHLFNQERQAFYKGVRMVNGELQHDATIDTSSVFGVFMFGLFDTHSSELQSAVATLEQVFDFIPGRTGLPRYENDNYYRINTTTPGNWWNITTLWLAQYYTEMRQPEKAAAILAWVVGHVAAETGIMAEQLNPNDGTSLSVAPLTWSHAEYIATLLDTITET